MFICIEGADGVGKTTQVKLLERALIDRGYDVLCCRDPGSTPLGEAIRKLLLDRLEIPIGSRAEMLLYMAARSQLVEEVILPALKEGKIVISDRYLLSNVAYQGYGGGLEPTMLWAIGEAATQGVMPDLTIVLDLPPELACERRPQNTDRLEARGIEFQHRVRLGFLEEGAKQPGIIQVIDASPDPLAVHQRILELVLPPLEAKKAVF